MLPQIVLSPFAGVIVDRLDLRWRLVVPNIARTLMTLGLALAGANVPMLLALNLGISLTSVALTPAEGSMIPRVVPKAQLQTAMGIFNLTLQASFAVGFAFLGPLLVTIGGPSSVLAVVTALYVAATLACIGLPSAPPEPRDQGRGPDGAPRPAPRAARGPARHPPRPRGQPADPAPGRGGLRRGRARRAGPGLATTVGLEPTQLAVVVLPLGVGVVFGVVGLRRFGARCLATAGRRGRARRVRPADRVAGPRRLARRGAGGGRRLGAADRGRGRGLCRRGLRCDLGLGADGPPGIDAAEVRGRVFGVLASIVSAASLVPTLVAGPLADRVSPSLVIGIVGLAVCGLGLWSAFLFGPLAKRRRVLRRGDPLP